MPEPQRIDPLGGPIGSIEEGDWSDPEDLTEEEAAYWAQVHEEEYRKTLKRVGWPEDWETTAPPEGSKAQWPHDEKAVVATGSPTLDALARRATFEERP